MTAIYTLKRIVKEVLGMPQYPRRAAFKAKTFEEQLYCGLIEKGDFCFDVGANIGEISRLMARLSGPGGCVVAFEPVPSTYRLLCEHLQRDAYEKAVIVTLPFGLSDSSGFRAVSIPGELHTRASLASAESWSAAQSSAVTARQCRFETLDETLSFWAPLRPSFLKIDVEGAELMVLKGGAKSFTDGLRPLIVMELFAPWQAAYGLRPWDVLSFLKSLGYFFNFVCPDGLVEHVPTEGASCPAAFERGDTVIAYEPAVHGPRIERLNGLIRSSRDLHLATPPLLNR